MLRGCPTSLQNWRMCINPSVQTKEICCITEQNWKLLCMRERLHCCNRKPRGDLAQICPTARVTLRRTRDVRCRLDSSCVPHESHMTRETTCSTNILSTTSTANVYLRKTVLHTWNMPGFLPTWVFHSIWGKCCVWKKCPQSWLFQTTLQPRIIHF